MSSEDTIVSEAIAAHRNGELISDLQARVIAARWHGGQTSALYSLASSGATVARKSDLEPDEWGEPLNRAAWEIEKELDIPSHGNGNDALDHAELSALLAYVESVGPRGPVDGWNNLNY